MSLTPDERDSPYSVSPLSRTPRPRTPIITKSPNGYTDSPAAIPSPLRTEHRLEGDEIRQTRAQSSSPYNGHKKSALAPPPPLTDFPFYAPPGALGENPTTEELVVKARHQESNRESADVSTELPEQGLDGQLSRKRTREAGVETATPPGRRSVQFARAATDVGMLGHSRQQSAEQGEEEGTPTRDNDKASSSLIAKLKALTAPISMPGHGRSLSGWTIGEFGRTVSSSGPQSPEHDRFVDQYPGLSREDSEADADGEESAAEGPADGSSRRRRRKLRPPLESGTSTAPTTPRATKMPSFLRDSPLITPTSSNRPNVQRRATMTEIPEHSSARLGGVSEDEGRERYGKVWRRGTALVQSARGLSSTAVRSRPTENHQQGESADTRRPRHLRRLTGFGGTTGPEGALSWRQKGERTTSVSAQKWRQIKAGLKMLGQKKRVENAVDHAKSAELVAELLSGAPAALLLASMFQRDEHGHRRIPVLLEQLKVKVVDATNPTSDRSGDRHLVFRLELEYGNGLTRMKWQIQRSLRDFVNLHMKYKLQSGTDRIQFKSDDAKSKLPRFPKSAFPYMKGIRGLADDDFDDDELPPVETDGEISGPDRFTRRTPKRRTSNVFSRRKNSFSGAIGSMAEQPPPTPGATPRQETYQERQRRRLEQYIQQMIQAFMFRPDSNRLCRFLELSALGMRLACEGGYKGKEGYMLMQSGKGIDFRKRWTPKLFKQRHSPKWFLVRHSYVVSVDSPSDMNVYDVLLVDPDFVIGARKKLLGETTKESDTVQREELSNKKSVAHPNHHMVRLSNSERKMKFLAKNERQLAQFIESLTIMSNNTLWSKPHRFDCFAPVRNNAWAQWLVDGRDYMWNVSRALEAARDSIYIHDWWLSPELYLRRPPAISQKWRLDRVLKRKAEQGVKVFVIMYRNINSAIPIDSEYSKFSLLDLHPYVYVQRSPNQLRQNTFFWAHHEKVCVVDNMVGFCGGIDLCFGRWDTPGHAVHDDKLTGFEFTDQTRDSDHCQLWPGKDYSNPRVQDFYDLHKPYEEMYDRSRVPRMPWHDIGMQVVGQPARDLGRHFTQRWNYILRQKKSSRALPHLLPPPDFGPGEVEALGLDGTCEIQILRSACEWSLGTPGKTEHSIMNAYVAAIESSLYHVYIENQFFISSCEVEGTRVHNRIGDALVQRIIRADADGEDWRAVVIIPLVPGFQNTVDAAEGSSVRLIMQCQYSSICRGPTSIFGRLRAKGIDARDYIEFYSLRSWGMIGPTKALVTEQLYIHAKCMVVDDQVAIIGSANINERSMLGSRDSEVAAIVRDREMIWSRMGGKRVRVGRFPHTMRVRLMREHLGIDVDDIQERERVNEEYERVLRKMSEGGSQDGHNSDSDADEHVDGQRAKNFLKARHTVQDEYLARAAENLHSFNHDYDIAEDTHSKDKKGKQTDPRIVGNEEHRLDVEGEGFDHMKDAEALYEHVGRDSTVDQMGREVLIHGRATEGFGSLSQPRKHSVAQSRKRSISAPQPYGDAKDRGNIALPPSQPPRMDTQMLGLTLLSQLPALPVGDDTDIGGPPLQRSFSHSSMTVVAPLISSMNRPILTEDCCMDPLSSTFNQDIWHQIAVNNTKIYRTVFRCMPDDDVRDWATYHEYAAFGERFSQSMGIGKNKMREAQERPSRSTGPPGAGASIPEKVVEKAQSAGLEKLPSRDGKRGHSHSQGDVLQWAEEQEKHIQASRQTQLGSTDVADTAINEKTVIPDDEPPSTLTAEPSQAALDSNFSSANASVTRERTITYSEPFPPANVTSAAAGAAPNGTANKGSKRRRRGTTKSSTRFRADSEDVMLERDDAEKLLSLVQGHLVVFPYDWLEKEEKDGGWLYAVDQIAPLEIYT